MPIRGEIIVVEDDPTLRELMVKIVEEIDAKAMAFETADDALTYLLQSQSECCLVIADHGVPGQIQGAEFIEMVREEMALHCCDSDFRVSDRSCINPVFHHLPAQALVPG